MADLLFMVILVLMSWLIQQVESGIEINDNESDEPAVENVTGSEDVGNAQLGVEGVVGEPYEPITQAIKIAIAAFSLLLLGLSISAYRKTGLRKIIYAAVAFGLFALQMVIDYLEDAVQGFDMPYADIIFYGITLTIVVLFFMAIVRRK